MSEVAIISKKESEQIEFKKSTSELKEGVIDICAIVNKHGSGQLYFGVKNNGEICGQQVGEKTKRDISQAIAAHIKPAIYPVIQEMKKGGKSIIEVSFNGAGKVYTAYGKAYIRVADESRELSSDEYEKMLREKSDSRWETGISSKKISDVNVRVLKEYLKRAKEAGRIVFKYKNVKQSLNKLGLIRKGKLIKAAEVLFCDGNSLELKAAVFAGKDRITFLDIKQFRGSILDLLKDGNEYIKEHINWRADLSGQRRIEIPEVPERAVAEAVVNSLCHRDFESVQSNEIAVYKDRIEIFNPGGFPDGLKPSDFISGAERSHPRNPLIAEILYYSKDIEKFGTGLKRISEECKENKVDVKFEILKSGYQVVFRRAVISITPAGQDKDATGTKPGLSWDQAGTKSALSRHQVGAKSGLDESEITKVLKFCIDPKSAREMMALFDWKDRTKFKDKYIKPLLKLKLLNMTIPEKPNSSKQRYATTKRAMNAIK